MSIILNIIGIVADFFKAIWNAPRDIGKIGIIAAIVVIGGYLYFDGLLDDREEAGFTNGYLRAQDSTSQAWIKNYNELLNARTSETTTHSTTVRPSRPVRGSTTSRTSAPDTAQLNALRWEYEQRETELFDRYLRATQIADFNVDTSLGFLSGVDLRAKLDGTFNPDPDSRIFDYVITPFPVIVDSVMWKKEWVTTDTVTVVNWWYVGLASAVTGALVYLVGSL